MKKYKVSCWRTQYGCFYVEAKNIVKAEVKARNRLYSGQPFDKVWDGEEGVADIQEETEERPFRTLRID